MTIPAPEALARLRDGNRTFVASLRDPAATVTSAPRLPLPK